MQRYGVEEEEGGGSGRETTGGQEKQERLSETLETPQHWKKTDT